MEEIEGAMRRGAWTEAAALCREEILRHPTVSRTHGYLGVCLFRQGDFPTAADSFKRAIALDPHFADAGIKLAQCYQQMHLYEEAFREAEHWCHFRPNDHTLQGLIEFLRPMVHGEHHRWERTIGLERRIEMPNK